MALPVIGGSDGAWGTTLTNFLGGADGAGVPTIPNNRVPYLSGGNHTSSANLTFDGTRLTTTRVTINCDDAAQIALIVNTAAAATAATQAWQFNGVNAVNLFTRSTNTVFTLEARNFGNDIAGSTVEIFRNTSAGVEGPAAGSLRLLQAAGGSGVLWMDNTAAPGLLRVNTAAPTGSSGAPTTSDTAGTVVGTQTSWWKLKQNITPFADYKKALAAIVETPLFSFDMNGRHYDAGYVIHEEDRGRWFSWNDGRQQIPALNERQIAGYFAASIKALHARLEILEGRTN